MSTWTHTLRERERERERERDRESAARDGERWTDWESFEVWAPKLPCTPGSGSKKDTRTRHVDPDPPRRAGRQWRSRRRHGRPKPHSPRYRQNICALVCMFVNYSHSLTLSPSLSLSLSLALSVFTSLMFFVQEGRGERGRERERERERETNKRTRASERGRELV